MKPLIYQYRMQWRELLQCVGIVPDNISSLVHAFGIRLKKQEIWHPAYEAFCRCGEPYVLTMENLKGITEVQPVGTCVYIVENEMVFSYLMEQVQGKNVSLLCTSGQPRYAALKLISLIVQSGIPIYYSGDLDPDVIKTRICKIRIVNDGKKIEQKGFYQHDYKGGHQTGDEFRII